MVKLRVSGFSLAEVLIALAILGVIATFAIPKVIQAQQKAAYNAQAKEIIATYANALETHRRAGLLTTTLRPATLLSTYFNYVATDISSDLDGIPGSSSPASCSTGTGTCYRLHSGGLIRPQNCQLGNTSDPAYATSIYYDPDGVYTTRADTLQIILHSNGKVETLGIVSAGTTLACGSPVVFTGPNPALDPTWFSW